MTDQEKEHDFQIMAQQFPGLASVFNELQSIAAEIEKINTDGGFRNKADREAEEMRAEKARSGELGPEWMQIQKRIDQKETTVEDVFTGRDSSAEAQAMRQQASKNLGRLHAQWTKEADEEGVNNLLTEMRVAKEAQEALVRDLRSRIRSSVNGGRGHD